MNTNPNPRARHFRSHLKALVLACKKTLFALDVEMEKPSSPQRGEKIAAICNFLNLENDCARHFGLGESLRKQPRKKTQP